MRRIKIVDRGYSSNVSYFMSGAARVAYSTKEWTHPPDYLAKAGYGLCVFDNLANAIGYMGFSGDSTEIRQGFIVARELIWIADCNHPMPARPRLLPYDVERGVLTNPDPSGSISDYSSTWPRGTEFYMNVKLVRPINLNDLRKAMAQIK